MHDLRFADKWGIRSIGRSLALHARGTGIETRILHFVFWENEGAGGGEAQYEEKVGCDNDTCNKHGAALYHIFFHFVDMHNGLRQGEVSMADVCDAKKWEDRQFAEGLGFWEVTVYKALTFWHPDYKELSHLHFRKLLAHAMLTLGKVKFGETNAAATAEAGPSCSYCVLENFNKLGDGGDNEGHKCAYCPAKAYFYCKTCFPDGGETITAACCAPELGRNCFAKHVAKVQPKHGMRRKIAIAATRKSPRRNTQARTGSDADDDDDADESPPIRPRRL